VAFFLEVGLLLIVLPWSSFWDRNYFAYAWPALRPVLTNNFVRGAVTGLGVVNLVAGVFELLPVFRSRQGPPAAVDIDRPAGFQPYASPADTQADS
jgi:hypothetical protein